MSKLNWNYRDSLPISTKPLIEGLTADEWQTAEKKEEARLACGETREITEREFREMIKSDVIFGIKLPVNVDEYLLSHGFTMNGRPKLKIK